MNHAYLRIATYGALMFFGAALAIAEEFSSLGEVLDKGGKRLDAAELKALLTGATISGKVPKFQTYHVQTRLADDGKATGSVSTLTDNQPPVITKGTWRINEQGQLCVDISSASKLWAEGKSCTSYYVVNDVHYAAPTDDRTAVVVMRKITR